jgi:hypothetical protein
MSHRTGVLVVVVALATLWPAPVRAGDGDGRDEVVQDDGSRWRYTSASAMHRIQPAPELGFDYDLFPRDIDCRAGLTRGQAVAQPAYLPAGLAGLAREEVDGATTTARICIEVPDAVAVVTITRTSPLSTADDAELAQMIRELIDTIIANRWSAKHSVALFSERPVELGLTAATGFWKWVAGSKLADQTTVALNWPESDHVTILQIIRSPPPSTCALIEATAPAPPWAAGVAVRGETTATAELACVDLTAGGLLLLSAPAGLAAADLERVHQLAVVVVAAFNGSAAPIAPPPSVAALPAPGAPPTGPYVDAYADVHSHGNEKLVRFTRARFGLQVLTATEPSAQHATSATAALDQIWLLGNGVARFTPAVEWAAAVAASTGGELAYDAHATIDYGLHGETALLLAAIGVGTDGYGLAAAAGRPSLGAAAFASFGGRLRLRYKDDLIDAAVDVLIRAGGVDERRARIELTFGEGRYDAALGYTGYDGGARTIGGSIGIRL